MGHGHHLGTPRGRRARFVPRHTHTETRRGRPRKLFCGGGNGGQFAGGSPALQTCLKGWSRGWQPCATDVRCRRQHSRAARTIVKGRRRRRRAHTRLWIARVQSTTPAASTRRPMDQCLYNGSCGGVNQVISTMQPHGCSKRKAQAREAESEGKERRQRMHTSKHKENNCTHASAQRGFSLSAASYLYN